MRENFDNNNTTNWNVLKKLWRRKYLGCAYCPPNKMENRKRKSKTNRPILSWKLLRKKQNKYNPPI